MSVPRGVWIWELAKVDSGYLAHLQAIRTARVYLKVMDGASAPMFWEFQCTPQIVQALQRAGIQVFGWGYHYAVQTPSEEIAAVKSAMDCGLDGYVADIEREAEAPGAEAKVSALLDGIRPLVPTGNLGYTSFGAPQFHSNVPWAVLNTKTDFALPQIYFEDFTFGPSHQAEVDACVAANQQLPGMKVILPVWSSEDGARTPATAAELQGYLDRFDGSSIWRIPQGAEKGEAWNLHYDGT